MLATNKGQVLTYSQLYGKVWGDTAIGNESKTVGYHIWNFRKKLCKPETSPPKPKEAAYTSLSPQVDVHRFFVRPADRDEV